MERRYQDSGIIEIYEGTVEIQSNNMAHLLMNLNMEFIRSTLT